MKKRERIYIDGDRFEAAIGPSRVFSDIMDRKTGGAFVLVDREGLEELKKIVALLLGDEPAFSKTKRFEAYVSVNGKFADIVDRRQGKRIIALDKKAVEELGQMTDEVLDVLVD